MRNLGFIITFCLASIALPLNVFALGLGDIEINSFLNQPLKAEIVVISTRSGEIDDLLVGLASRDAFTRAGLSRPNYLSELRFLVQKNEEGDEAVILITTKSAIKEPFINFLIEADWSKGRLIKEFTVFLDPPFYADSAPPPVPAEPITEISVPAEAADTDSVKTVDLQTAAELLASPGPVATGATAMAEPIATSESIATIDQDNISDTPQPDEASAQPSEVGYLADDAETIFDGEIQIIKGNTLWSLAARYKDSAHTMAQVMLAIQRGNPDAFGDDNINFLKIGAVLRAPDANELDLLSKQEAHAQVLVQNGLWDDYVARVTGTTSAAMADDEGSAEARDSSEMVQGDLSLLAPGDGASDAAGLPSDGEDANELMKQLVFAEEELEASRVDNNELESKISDLEARLSKFEELQKMVEIEDDSLAQLQALQAEEQAASAEAETETEEAAFSDEDLLEDLLADEVIAEVETSEVTEVATSLTETDLIEEPESSPPATVIVTDSGPKTGTFLDDILPAEILDMIPMDLLDTLPSMDSVMQDPIMLGTLGGIVVMLLILVLYRRRKRSSEEDDDKDEGFTISEPDDAGDDLEDDFTPVGLVGASETEVDTNINIPDEEDLIENTQSAIQEVDAVQEVDDFMATSVISKADVGEVSAEDASASEQDDVLDEVDVYLAYGLYDNAEELLNQKLESDPQRADYRSKLLDTYFATKNTGEFVKQAETLKSMGETAERYWDRIQVMGYELAPDNALFSGGKDSTLTPADLGLSKPETADFDLGAEEDDTNFSITDFNLGEESDDIPDIQTAAPTETSSRSEAKTELLDLTEMGDGDDIKSDEAAEASESQDEPLPDLEDLDFSFDAESADEKSDADGMDFELPVELDLGDSDGPDKVDEPLEVTGLVDVPDDFADQTDLGDLDELEAEEPSGTGETELTAVLGTVDFPEEDSDKLESGDISEDESEVDIEATAMVGTVDFPAAAGDDIDLGLDDTSEQPLISAGDDDELKMDLVDDDSLAMDVDLDTDDENRKTNTFAPGDFDDPEELSPEETIIEGLDLDDISGLMLPDDVDEVSTKLDLARAFIDMGDAEGARGSLNEVLAEGNEEQKSEAQSLLKQI